MNTKRLTLAAIVMLLVPTAAFAIDFKQVNFSGSVVPGGMLGNDPKSSKFNEYRVIKDGVYLFSFNLDALDTEKGYFCAAQGSDVFRHDENINATLGNYGYWKLGFEWDEIPHLLSIKSQTPYRYAGNGLFEVPLTVPQTATIVQELVPSTANQVNVNDPATAAYLSNNIIATNLDNQRDKATVTLDGRLLEDLNFHLGYSHENRDGNKITYGPIGDRPPRTLNIQMPEPIDYNINEITVKTDYRWNFIRANFSYLYSNFDQNNSSMRWQNIYSNPGGTEETWGGTTPRIVATYGRRALEPSNHYNNVALALGVDMPFESYLVATLGYGFMVQDKPLIPYSTLSVSQGGIPWNVPSKLPETFADGKINTSLYNFDYIIRPISSLNLRAFFRFYDLNNRTNVRNWLYVTDDTTNTDGSVSYVNNRQNLGYAYDKRNYGLDAWYSLNFWSSTLGFVFDREGIDRTFREANTEENIFKLTLRSHPLNGVNFRGKFLYGDRDMDATYNYQAPSGSYTYTFAQATDNNNPKFTFENHPDMRMFDVSDRVRRQFGFDVSVSPSEKIDFSGFYDYQKSDYDSGVTPVQPLAGYPGAISDANRFASTPGNQVGLLETTMNKFGVDVSFVLNEQLTLNTFYSFEEMESEQRGFEFDENFKANPATIPSTTELGPWTRSTMQWLAKMKDLTNEVGLGASFVIIKEKLNFLTEGVISLGQIKIDYSGFGAVSSVNPANPFPDNYQFAFRSPPNVRQDRYTIYSAFEYQLIKDLIIRLGYLFEQYMIRDWQQEKNTPWYESVSGNEHLLRDTSQSSQWGNRLVNFGSYLAPSYVAHFGSLSVSYKF